MLIVNAIGSTQAIGHFNFGPLCAYLTLNYLDRFLSAYELPVSWSSIESSICCIFTHLTFRVIWSMIGYDLQKGRAWMMQLLAVTCLSLAAKMEESEVPLSLDLQVDIYSITCVYTIQFLWWCMCQWWIWVFVLTTDWWIEVFVWSQNYSKNGAFGFKHLEVEDASDHSIFLHRLFHSQDQWWWWR